MDSSSNNSDNSSDSAGIKAIITCGLLLLMFVLSIVIAKLCDMCYDRRTIADDSSDVSEHTKSLIRARLAVIQFKKKKDIKPKEVTKASTVNILRKWNVLAKSKADKREKILNPNRPISANDKHSKSVAITIDKNPLPISGEKDTGIMKIFCNKVSDNGGIGIAPLKSPSPKPVTPRKELSTLSAKDLSASVSNGTKPSKGTKSVHFEDEVIKPVTQFQSKPSSSGVTRTTKPSIGVSKTPSSVARPSSAAKTVQVKTAPNTGNTPKK